MQVIYKIQLLKYMIVMQYESEESLNMKEKAVYIGSNPDTAEYLLHCDWLELCGIVCETIHMSDDMLTFSLVRGIKLYVVNNKAELVEALCSFGADHIYIIHIFGMRVPMDQLEGFRIFNIHPSMLPNYKGPHPTYWQTVRGELEIGMSIHEITAALDEGTLISQYKTDYYLWENEKDLTKKLCQFIPKLLEDLHTYIVRGKMGNALVTPGDYYPKVTRKDVFIDLEQDSPALIYNKIRAEAAYGGAKILLGDQVYCLYHIRFSNRVIRETFTETNGLLIIRYSDSIVITADKYERLEGVFKFNYEK